jgi:hypothetical protein
LAPFILEVVGNDMAWHPAVVMYSRCYESTGARKAAQEKEKEDKRKAAQEKEDTQPLAEMGVNAQQLAEMAQQLAEMKNAIEDAQPLAEMVAEMTKNAIEDAQPLAEMMVNAIRPNGIVDYGNRQDQVRPQEDSVRALFGRAPFFWQQYALLRAEKKAQFLAKHPSDYNEIDWTEFGRAMFMTWIDGPKKPDEWDHGDETWEEHKRKLAPRVYNPKFGAYYHAFDEHPGVQEASRVLRTGCQLTGCRLQQCENVHCSLLSRRSNGACSSRS